VSGGEGKARSKIMSQTLRGHNLRTMVVMALLAVLLLLALVGVAESAATISDRDGNPAIHAMSTDDTGRSGPTKDPPSIIDRHAAVISRYHQESLR
jgi:hypothetical protein